jgi:hypothetical protein
MGAGAAAATLATGPMTPTTRRVIRSRTPAAPRSQSARSAEADDVLDLFNVAERTYTDDGNPPLWEIYQEKAVTLMARRRYDAGRDTAAVLDLDALSLGPLADLGSVDGGAAAPDAGSAPGRAAGPPGVREVPLSRLAQLVAVRRAEVDLVFRAVQAEADGAGRLPAVEVINEQRLNSLSHEMTPIPSGEGKRHGIPQDFRILTP